MPATATLPRSVRALIAATRSFRQLHEAAADHGQLAVLVARFLLDLDEVAAVLHELPDDGAVDPQRVAFGIVAADLAVRTTQDAVVAHPVGQVMREPRAALGAVVIRAGRAHHRRELLLPVHALGTIRNLEPVLDAEPGMTIDLLPRKLVRADVEAAPPLRICDEAGDRHRPLRHRREALPLAHVTPAARQRAADFLVRIECPML